MGVLRASSAQIARPVFMQQRCTDEYRPLPYSAADLRVIARASDHVEAAARGRTGSAAGRAATAAGLISLNQEWGSEYYLVPPEAVVDDAAAAETFDGPETVIDVQTHFMAPHCQRSFPTASLTDLFRAAMPDWWTEMDEVAAYDLATYIKTVYLDSETTVAVLTSGPGLDDWRNLFNDEMASTRALVDGLAGSGRLLNHSVVHANVDHELESMDMYAETYAPAGWKVYTMGVLSPDGPVHGWMLDDDQGLKFLQKARELDVRLVCAHKGISYLADNGSPRDIGPAAAQFPDLDFIVYHSGYEMPSYSGIVEGPYSPTEPQGVDRLIKSVLDAGIARGGNVHAELGSTWFSLIRRPVEAAHVLGKLLQTLGEDNVVWGTDSIWYGSTQPIIDAFRSFQIPDWMCERFGYEPISAGAKEKILSLNAARLYGIDLERVRKETANDDLAWARQLVAEYRDRHPEHLR